jgi:hypothetical protein
MATPSEKNRAAGQPQLSDLFARYLHGQMSLQEAGFEVVQTGDVVPFEAAPAQPADAKLAWEEALAILPFYPFKGKAQSFKAPPDWSALVASQEPIVAVSFCLGNFPQMVRSLQPLLHPDKLQATKSTNAPSGASAELVSWASKVAVGRQFSDKLIAAAVLRLARNFDRAESLLGKESAVPEDWRGAWENERAALAWHRGQAKEALASWQAQPDSVPVLFNRGMACLFTNQRADARAFLQKAVTHLDGNSAWYHLDRLYLALAEMKA